MIIYSLLTLPRFGGTQPFEIFQTIQRNLLPLTTHQDSFFNSTYFDTAYAGIEALEMPQFDIGHLSEAFIDIDELGGYIAYYVSDITYRDSFIIWTGKSYTHSRNGYLVLIQNGEHTGGFLSEGPNFWELYPCGNFNMLAIKRNPTHDQYFGCASNGEIDSLTTTPGPTDPPDPCQIPTNKCQAEIRVFVGLTPEANAWIQLVLDHYGSVVPYFGKRMLLLALEESVNLAFRNSGINNKRIRIGHVQDITIAKTNVEIPPGNSMPDILGDINALEINGAFNSILHGTRCDLGVVLTHRQYPNYAGIVNALGPDDAFCSIVEIQYALGSRLVFAHEIGHLFGCRHEKPFDSHPGCNHAWGIVDEDNVIIPTIVHFYPFGHGTLHHYSNPFVKVLGQRTGTGSDFNAAAIDNNGCYIADYKDDPYWFIDITGLDTICATEPVNLTYSALVNEPASSYIGHPPYTFIWQHGYAFNDTNFPDLNWQIQPNQGEQLLISYIPSSGQKELFIRLIAVSSDGHVAMEVKHVILFPEGCEPSESPEPYEWKPRSVDIQTATGDSCEYLCSILEIESGFWTILCSSATYETEFIPSLPIEAILFDMTGRIHLKAPIHLNQFHEMNLSSSGLMPGLYWVIVRTPCNTFIRKFVMI